MRTPSQYRMHPLRRVHRTTPADNMHIRVLGASAGGGFPQWNCNGHMSAAARAGKHGFRPRTQSSLAVSADGKRWVLLNCSPDLRQQIAATPALWPDPNGAKRNSPIRAVVVTNADVDHIIGLINLREAQPFTIFGSDRVLKTINANSVFNVCNPELVPRIQLPLDEPIALTDHGDDLGLTIEPFAVPCSRARATRWRTSAAARATPSASRSPRRPPASTSSTSPVAPRSMDLCGNASKAHPSFSSTARSTPTMK